MAGKAKKPNWGGKREGSGRKPAFMLTDNQVKSMLTTARKRAKVEGKTVDDILLDLIYGKLAYEVVTKKGNITTIFDVSPKEKIAAIKVFKDFTIGKRVEQETHNYKHNAPVIGLPPMDEDPALKVVNGGKK